MTRYGKHVIAKSAAVAFVVGLVMPLGCQRNREEPAKSETANRFMRQWEESIPSSEQIALLSAKYQLKPDVVKGIVRVFLRRHDLLYKNLFKPSPGPGEPYPKRCCTDSSGTDCSATVCNATNQCTVRPFIVCEYGRDPPEAISNTLSELSKTYGVASTTAAALLVDYRIWDECQDRSEAGGSE